MGPRNGQRTPRALLVVTMVVTAAAALAVAPPVGAHGDAAARAASTVTEAEVNPSGRITGLEVPVQTIDGTAGLDAQPTPRAECGPGSHPETGAQGRVPRSEVESGRAAEGYWCNAELVSHVGQTGGYKVERYVDTSGNECAYYDTTLLFPANVINLSGGDLTGVAVLDMSDPSEPVKTTTLVSPAMQSPHESLVLNQERGLLAAVTANPIYYPGIVDIYDLTEDCRQPTLKASAAVGVLGHESGFAPDGNTLYISSLSGRTVTAIDVSDPTVPLPLGIYDFNSHGINLSDDGNRLYMAANGNESSNSPKGLLVLDVSEIQSREPNPTVEVLSRSTWALVSTPQINVPVTIDGHPYLVEMDEFRGSEERVGAARIIDIADETAPVIVSDIRLEVNQAEAHRGEQADDPGTGSLQNYTGHYCDVPSRVDPGIVACTFILSGLRVFDIRDPAQPREIAYFNGPINASAAPVSEGAYAMASPSFAPERREIWYSDGNSGFYAVRLTNGVWDPPEALAADAATPTAAPSDGAPPRSQIPATGAVLPVLAGLAAAGAALGLRRLERRSTCRQSGS
ncbi:MAG TPA: hypothetical protein VMN58_11370 [Acidimicrobiales bacterium]|nr:hypothetical protein [Acidimicrobiales bacterium]